MKNLEHKVVGAALQSSDARRKMVEKLVDADLTQFFKSTVAAEVAAMIIADPDINTGVLIDKLEAHQAMWIADAVGEIHTEAYAKTNIGPWLDAMYVDYSQRRLTAGVRATADAIESGKDPAEAFGNIELTNSSLGLIDAASAAARWRAWRKNMNEHPPYPLPLGLSNLMPLRMGQLWILAARPGVGKTWFAIQHALLLAREGVEVLFISLEMPLHQIVERFKQLDADGSFETLPIRFYEPKQAITPFEVIRTLVWSQAKWAKVVVIDHFKLIYDPAQSDEYRSMASVATQLAHLAKGGPTIQLICHVNRTGASAERIGMEHLGGTGRLEEMADAVLLFTNETVRLAKARYGKQGTVRARMSEVGRWIAMGEATVG